MARVKFLCDAERCIECNACVTICKNEHEVPWGMNRRRVVTLRDGLPGERSVSMACMHCTDAPCASVCPAGRLLQVLPSLSALAALPAQSLRRLKWKVRRNCVSSTGRELAPKRLSMNFSFGMPASMSGGKPTLH